MNTVSRKVESLACTIHSRMKTALTRWYDQIAPWEETVWPEYVAERKRRNHEEHARKKDRG